MKILEIVLIILFVVNLFVTVSCIFIFNQKDFKESIADTLRELMMFISQNSFKYITDNGLSIVDCDKAKLTAELCDYLYSIRSNIESASVRNCLDKRDLVEDYTMYFLYAAHSVLTSNDK